jgi:hypothetical protein
MIERHSNRNFNVLVGHILRDRIIREPRERTASARDKNFDLVDGGVFLRALENFVSLVFSQHIEPLAISH